MSAGMFEATCAMNSADKAQVTKNPGNFTVEVCQEATSSWCSLSFEDALALAEYIVTELEEEEV